MAKIFKIALTSPEVALAFARPKGFWSGRLPAAAMLLFCGLRPMAVDAAGLFFNPSSGSYTVNSAFSVNVDVSSADRAMNAASGVISFPQDKLEVASLSKSGSIFTLWVKEPSFSNSFGTVEFEGIVLNPGFTGTVGKVITINFKTKADGTAPVHFSSGSVLGNDGLGTDILKGMGEATYNITPAPPAPASAPMAPTAAVPAAPLISSSTHPAEDGWYASTDAKFSWPVPAGATKARVLVGKIPNASPTVEYAPAIGRKDVANLTDGIWFFSVQLGNGFGWGKISHFRIQVDTRPPEPFEIKFIDGKKTENPAPTVIFDATDTLSGIDHYKIKIGEGDFFSIAPEIVKNKPYALPPQDPGKRGITVQAFDKAGNYATAVEEFEILPKNQPSGKMTVTAAKPVIFPAVSCTAGLIEAAAPLAALVVLLLFIIWHGRHKFSLLRKRIGKEAREAESALHRAFDALKEDIREQIKLLEKTRGRRQLTEEEDKIVKQLKKDLDAAEKFVKKEIEDIEKEVK